MVPGLPISQNAYEALPAFCPAFGFGAVPTLIKASEMTPDRISLAAVIDYAKRWGLRPFSHERVGNLAEGYHTGSVSPPGSGWFVLVTENWREGIFSFEFSVPKASALVEKTHNALVLSFVSFERNTSQLYGRRHQFLFYKTQ